MSSYGEVDDRESHVDDDFSRQTSAESTQEEKELGCTDTVLAAVPTWMKPAITLFMHLVDWGSDVLVTTQFWKCGDMWWATMNAAFVLVGGFLSAVFAWQRHVRGGRLLLYVLGLGPIVEATMHPQIFSGKQELLRLVAVRAAETFGEAIPSAALQIYAIIYRGNATTLQYCSAGISVMSAGYGAMACLRDFDDRDMRRVSRSMKASAAIWILVMVDFLWRVVPAALFFSDPEFRPWSIQVLPPLMFLFELALLVAFEEQLGFFKNALGAGRWMVYPVVAMASCFTLLARVFLFLIYARTAEQRVKQMWISHCGQSILRIAALWIVRQSSWQLWLAGLTCCALATVSLQVLISAKRQSDEHRGSEDEYSEDVFETWHEEENKLLCFCW